MSRTELHAARRSQHSNAYSRWDGSGIRGFSSLLSLRDLMWRIERVGSPTNRATTLTWIIDMGGTSGLCTLFVGRMRMAVDEDIKAYFNKQIHGPAVPGFLWRSEARFDGDAVKHVLSETLWRQTYVGERAASLPRCSTGAGGRDSCGTSVLATSTTNASAPPLSSFGRIPRAETLPQIIRSIKFLVQQSVLLACSPPIFTGIPADSVYRPWCCLDTIILQRRSWLRRKDFFGLARSEDLRV